MKIDFKFQIGETVFLKTDPDQFPRMVVGIVVRRDCLVYECQFGMACSSHYDFEISNKKDVMIACGIEVENKEE